MSATISPPAPLVPPTVTSTQAAAAIAAHVAESVLEATPNSEPIWAKPAIAIFSQMLLAGVLVYAFLTKDQVTAGLVTGAVISMATTAGSYYLGSSSGSDRKTTLLAAAPPTVVKGP